jgi:hypothetical protein
MASGRRVVGNLPAELTSFVGRRDELAEVRRLLAGSRLVTLTGLGGVGKTRLALRAAAELRRAFRDGVWLVQLDQLRDEALVAQVVAGALGLQDRAGSAPEWGSGSMRPCRSMTGSTCRRKRTSPAYATSLAASSARPDATMMRRR